MNRRDFFGAIGATGGILAFGREPEVRYVMFNPPSDKTSAIYWTTGHDKTEMFLLSLGAIDISVDPSHVKQGWGSFKLDRIGMYLSDAPLENFEPITYWIPADALKGTSDEQT